MSSTKSLTSSRKSSKRFTSRQTRLAWVALYRRNKKPRKEEIIFSQFFLCLLVSTTDLPKTKHQMKSFSNSFQAKHNMKSNRNRFQTTKNHQINPFSIPFQTEILSQRSSSPAELSRLHLQAQHFSFQALILWGAQRGINQGWKVFLGLKKEIKTSGRFVSWKETCIQVCWLVGNAERPQRSCVFFGDKWSFPKGGWFSKSRCGMAPPSCVLVGTEVQNVSQSCAVCLTRIYEIRHEKKILGGVSDQICVVCEWLLLQGEKLEKNELPTWSNL